MSGEKWRDIPGLEGRYQASNHGRVRSLDRQVEQINRWGKPMQRIEYGALLAARHDRDGYLRTFSREFKATAVHRLVAMAFIPNPDNLPEINHKNGVKDDNRPSNLEWCTTAYNQHHRVHVLGGHTPPPVKRRTQITHPNGKVAVYPTATAAAQALGVVRTAVMNAARGPYKCQGCEVQYV